MLSITVQLITFQLNLNNVGRSQISCIWCNQRYDTLWSTGDTDIWMSCWSFSTHWGDGAFLLSGWGGLGSLLNSTANLPWQVQRCYCRTWLLFWRSPLVAQREHSVLIRSTRRFISEESAGLGSWLLKSQAVFHFLGGVWKWLCHVLWQPWIMRDSLYSQWCWNTLSLLYW